MLAKAGAHYALDAVTGHSGVNIPLCDGQPKSGDILIIFSTQQGEVLISCFAGAGKDLLELRRSG